MPHIRCNALTCCVLVFPSGHSTTLGRLAPRRDLFYRPHPVSFGLSVCFRLSPPVVLRFTDQITRWINSRLRWPPQRKEHWSNCASMIDCGLMVLTTSVLTVVCLSNFSTSGGGGIFSLIKIDKEMVLENYVKLFELIKTRVLRNHAVAFFHGHPETADEIRVFLRSSQILILESVLHEYRRENSTIYEPLDGIKALHHLVFMQTNWTFETIRSTSLSDLMLCIHNLITLDKSPPSVQMLVSPYIPEETFTFEQFETDDWNAKENSRYLKLN